LGQGDVHERLEEFRNLRPRVAYENIERAQSAFPRLSVRMMWSIRKTSA
jgi:hypothetical protein